MTIQKIIDSIAATLLAEYPGKDIYTENAPQGVTEPCFFVLPFGSVIRRVVGGRIGERYSVLVQYLPSSDTPLSECAEVEETLYRILEDVTVDGAIIHSYDISSETTDEVLSVVLVYEFQTVETDESAERMTSYSLQRRLT